jgi:hypothetical protein
MTAILVPEPMFPPEEGRVFRPGTMGWRASDLDDPLFARLWSGGRYEIIEGVPHYWVLDAFAKTLRAMVLEDGKYRAEASGKGDEAVRVSLFGGLTIPLQRVWGG